MLIDAATGAFTDSRDLPWYVTTLLVSQPLHFGDYGGMPMKIIWALLDIADHRRAGQRPLSVAGARRARNSAPSTAVVGGMEEPT